MKFDGLSNSEKPSTHRSALWEHQPLICRNYFWIILISSFAENRRMPRNGWQREKSSKARWQAKRSQIWIHSHFHAGTLHGEKDSVFQHVFRDGRAFPSFHFWAVGVVRNFARIVHIASRLNIAPALLKTFSRKLST